MTWIQMSFLRQLRQFGNHVYKSTQFRQFTTNNRYHLSQLQREPIRKQRPEEIDLDAPYPFRGSGAQKYKSKDTFVIENDVPDSQGMVITISMLVFMLYFFIFREENDIDAQLGKGFSESVPEEYEEQVIQMAIQMAKNERASTEELEKRLALVQEKRLRKEMGSE